MSLKFSPFLVHTVVKNIAQFCLYIFLNGIVSHINEQYLKYCFQSVLNQRILPQPQFYQRSQGHILKVYYHHKHFHSNIVQKKINKSKRWKTSRSFYKTDVTTRKMNYYSQSKQLFWVLSWKSTSVLCELWHKLQKESRSFII